MSSETSVGRRSHKPLIGLICLVGMAVGGFCGLLMLGKGLVFGLLGGLVAGLVWSAIMIPKVRRGQDNLMLRGLRWGVVVGLLAMVILHAGVMLREMARPSEGEMTLRGVYPIALVIGLTLAVVGGLTAGALCGWACQWASNRARAAGQVEEPVA